MHRAGWRVPVSEGGDIADTRARPAHAGALVAARLEAKYLVERAAAPALRARLEARLPVHHHSVPPGMALRAAHHVTTTVYFDTSRHDLYRAALRSPAHLKVRARTYHDEGRGGVAGPIEHATFWLELKERDGQRSRKQRAAFTRLEARAWLEALAIHDAAASAHACRARLEAVDEPARAALLGELAQTRATLGCALEPSCVVAYRREAFQDAAGALRVTLDHDVRAYRAPPEPFAPGALDPRALGRPAHEEPACVLEVKSLGRAPEWLGALLAEHGARAAEYSKLVMAARAVHELSAT